MSKHKLTFATEVDIVVHYTLYPGSPAVLNPVDRAHPEEPDEIEITAVYLSSGRDIIRDLTDTELDALEERVYEEAEAYAQDDMDDRADYEYERMKDRQMEEAFDKQQGIGGTDNAKR